MFVPERLIGVPFSEDLAKSLLRKPDEVALIDHFAGMEIREYPKNGLDVYLNERGEVVTLFFYGVEADDHARYEGELPGTLSFVDSVDDVLKKFGKPSRSNLEQSANVRWLRYDLTAYSVHVEFAGHRERILKITLMSPDVAHGEV